MYGPNRISAISRVSAWYSASRSTQAASAALRSYQP